MSTQQEVLPLLPERATPTRYQRRIFRERLPYLGTSRERNAVKELFELGYNPDLIELLTKPNDDVQKITVLYHSVAEKVLAGLQSFITNRRCSGITPIPSSLATPTGDTPRSASAAAMCRHRDGHRCVITGRRASQYSLEVAHIFPFGTSQNTNSRQEPFWKFLEIFMGVSRTNSLWEYVGADNINRLENLIVLDRSIHSLFDGGTMTLQPVQPFPDDYPSSYDVKFIWNSEFPLTENEITTTKPQGSGKAAQSVASGDIFRLSTTFNLPLPDPILLEIHQALNDLRHIFAAAPSNPFDDESYHSDMEKPHLVTDYGGIKFLTRQLSLFTTSTTGFDTESQKAVTKLPNGQHFLLAVVDGVQDGIEE